MNIVIEVGATEQEFLSNEPVAGELLSAKMAGAPLPPGDVLRYAIDIGAALQRAHLRGVVHGAIAPDSVLITGAGARLIAPQDVLRVAARPYRSPEQVRGAQPDSRSDIFSYGALLYEMISRARPFAGEGSALDTAILESAPPPLAAKTPVEAAFARVIAGCMEKAPAHRRQRVQNAVIELKLAGRAVARTLPRRSPPRAIPGAAPRTATLSGKTAKAANPDYWAPYGSPPGAFRRRLPVLILTAIAVTATAVAAALYLQKPAQRALKFAVNPPEHTSYPGTPAVSPDGHFLTFSAVGPEGHRMLWLRSLDEMHARLIPGTEGGFAPFWSPDSGHIGFFADRSLKEVHLLSDIGQVKPTVICDVDEEPGGGAWNKDGVIVFAPRMSGALYRVAASGGKPQQLLKLDALKSEHAQLWPQFLPDGKHFIFFLLTGMEDTTGVYAGSLESQETRRVLVSQTNAVYSPGAGESSSSGYLLFVKDRDLVAQPFSASKLATTGDAVVFPDEIGAVQSLSLAPISVSRNAVLVYQTIAKPTRQLVWLDRNGHSAGVTSEPGAWGPPKISPDGTRVAVGRMSSDGANAELWILDAAGNISIFQSEPHVSSGSPVWSPDGSKVAFWSNPAGVYDLYMKSVASTRAPELLLKSPMAKYPTDWSRDGKFLIFGELTPGTRSDVMALDLANRRDTPVVNTVYSEGYGTLSPDGRWIAYQSDESGPNEIYVQRFDNAAGTKRRWKVSADGGGMPRWRGDGAELFYLTVSGGVYAAAIHAQGDEFQSDPPKLLFNTRPLPKTWNLYDVSPDGQRFIVNLPLEWSNSSVITVSINWTEKLKS